MLYSLAEVMAMLRVLPDPARTTVAVAAFSGLRRCEIRGLLWEHYSGDELKVARSVWESFVNETKTRKSKASVPVIEPLRRLLDYRRLQCGNPASGVMFATMKRDATEFEQCAESSNLVRAQSLPSLWQIGR